RLRLRGARVRRLLDRRARDGAHRRGRGGLQGLRRRPARRRRRPQVGHDRPVQAAPRAGPARPAQGARALREPAPGAPAARPLRREPAQARGDRRHRPARDARADRRALLRQTRSRRRHGVRHLHLQRRRDRADRARRLPGGQTARHLRRQGERAGVEPPVARGRHAPARRGVPRRRAGARARRQRRDAARLQPVALRRDRHREHVRRHPQRRGGDADGLDRPAAERVPGRRRTRPVRAGPRLRAGHRREGNRQPAGDVPVGGADAAARTWYGEPGRGGRIGGRSCARRRLAHARPGRQRDDGRGRPSRVEPPLRSPIVDQADLIWMNGELVAWEDAKVHVLTHCLHYGTGVFEGMRAYETERGTAIFRHEEHLDRLYKSADLYYMPIPYTLQELRSAVHEVVAKNNLPSCYIRPIAFRGAGVMGINPLDAPVDVAIAAWPWGAYLGEEAKEQGVRAKVTSWRRISSDSLIPHAKASGQYLNSVLAKIESHKAGYEEGILLDDHGFVCEGTGENIYVVRD